MRDDNGFGVRDEMCGRGKLVRMRVKYLINSATITVEFV